MSLIKKLVPAVLVVTMLIIASVPASSTEKKESVNDYKELNMIFISNDDVHSLTTTISSEDYRQIEELFNSLSEYLKINMPEFWNDYILSGEERNEIVTELDKVLEVLENKIPNFPAVDVNCLVDLLCIDFPCLLCSDAIISVGCGSSCIPFYCYEAFLGMMFRPIIIKQCLGYTGFLNFNMIPPRIEYGDRFGMHKVRTFGFVGLYIYLGDLGVDMPFGPQLLVGKALALVGPDIP